MCTFTDLLAQAIAMINADGADPDGPVIRRGLLLAAHAGLTVDRDTSVSADWDLYTVAIGDAVTALHAGLTDSMVLTADLPDAGRDDPELRLLVRTLICLLADRYAAAAAEAGDGPGTGPIEGLPIEGLPIDGAAIGSDGAALGSGGTTLVGLVGTVQPADCRRRVWARVADRLDDAAAQLL